MNTPTIWITRPEADSKKLAEKLSDICQPIVLPCIEAVAKVFVPPDLTHIDIGILVSKPAVQFGLPTFNESAIEQIEWLAVGSSTALLASIYGVTQIVAPNEPTSEGLLQLDELSHVSGKNILLVAGVGGRDYLSNELKKRGANVTKLEVYQRRIPEQLQQTLEMRWHNTPPDYVVITSCEILKNLYDKTAGHSQSALVHTHLFVASNRIEQFARELGFKQTITNMGSAHNQVICQQIRKYIQQEKGST